MTVVDELDIVQIRTNESYEEIKNESQEASKEIPVKISDAEKVLKQRGRPKKVVEVEVGEI